MLYQITLVSIGALQTTQTYIGMWYDINCKHKPVQQVMNGIQWVYITLLESPTV